jgi:hypothetical protein
MARTLYRNGAQTAPDPICLGISLLVTTASVDPAFDGEPTWPWRRWSTLLLAVVPASPTATAT